MMAFLERFRCLEKPAFKLFFISEKFLLLFYFLDHVSSSEVHVSQRMLRFDYLLLGDNCCGSAPLFRTLRFS